MPTSKSGFTIVELIVVIVVIAILATISTVAYTGIQERAHNAATVKAAESWIKVLTLSYADRGSINITDSYPSGQCLGRLEDYPATSRFQAGQCYSNPNMYVSDQIQAAIESRVGRVTMTKQDREVRDPYDNYARGVQYYDDSAGHAIVYYLLGSDQDCVLAGSRAVTSAHNSTECSVIISDQLGGDPIVW